MSDLITTIRATVMRGVTAEIDAAVAKTLNAKLAGATSRGVRACAIDDNGHLIFTLTDGSVLDLGKVVGDDGVGISSIAKTGTVGLVDTYTITYTNGTTSSYTVTNGYTPVKGTDYWTNADKAEIVEYVADRMIFTVTFTETNGVITADKTILEILDAIDAKNRIDFAITGSDVVYQSFARGWVSDTIGGVVIESIKTLPLVGARPYSIVFVGTTDGETDTWDYYLNELALQESFAAYRTSAAQDVIDAGKQTKAITDAGGYFTTDTVEAALQQLGAELSGVNALIGSGSVG